MSSRAPDDRLFFETWPNDQPRNKAYVPWVYDEAVHIELIDSNSPYIADTVVIRWDGQEVFRRCILPQHPITALLDPEISAQPHQIDIETGNVDGFKNFRFKMPAAPTDDDAAEDGRIEVRVYGRREKEPFAPRGSIATRGSGRILDESYLIGAAKWDYRSPEWLLKHGYKCHIAKFGWRPRVIRPSSPSPSCSSTSSLSSLSSSSSEDLAPISPSSHKILAGLVSSPTPPPQTSARSTGSPLDHADPPSGVSRTVLSHTSVRFAPHRDVPASKKAATASGSDSHASSSARPRVSSSSAPVSYPKNSPRPPGSRPATGTSVTPIETTRNLQKPSEGGNIMSLVRTWSRTQMAAGKSAPAQPSATRGSPFIDLSRVDTPSSASRLGPQPTPSASSSRPPAVVSKDVQSASGFVSRAVASSPSVGTSSGGQPVVPRPVPAAWRPGSSSLSSRSPATKRPLTSNSPTQTLATTTTSLKEPSSLQSERKPTLVSSTPRAVRPSTSSSQTSESSAESSASNPPVLDAPPPRRLVKKPTVITSAPSPLAQPSSMPGTLSGPLAVGASKSGSMPAESRRLGQDEEHANRLKRKRLEKNKRQVEIKRVDLEMKEKGTSLTLQVKHNLLQQSLHELDIELLTLVKDQRPSILNPAEVFKLEHDILDLQEKVIELQLAEVDLRERQQQEDPKGKRKLEGEVDERRVRRRSDDEMMCDDP